MVFFALSVTVLGQGVLMGCGVEDGGLCTFL